MRNMQLGGITLIVFLEMSDQLSQVLKSSGFWWLHCFLYIIIYNSQSEYG